ncbi:MAG: sugar ABC transporter substrate-binding protein [Spirochaetaceae bacterium]|jgi:ribose transport system substrate-binding protein|nr:sugar ABC transporter substrate-binding protein [Spirochaetaceae bacterium]
MKKVILGITAAALVLGAAACQKQPKQKTFAYTCWSMNNPFFITLEKAIRAEVEKAGDKLITLDPAGDIGKQINQIEDVISQGIAGMYLNPVDNEGIRPALLALKNANIPTVNFDTAVKDLDLVASFVASDNENAGFVCGEDIVKRFPQGGTLVILEMPVNDAVNSRLRGFERAIEGKGFTIAARQDAKGDLQQGLQKMEDILQSVPKIDAVMGGNDPMALGAFAAARTANRSEMLIYGVDGSPDAKAAIAQGGIFAGTGAQSPMNIGIESVKVMQKILAKESYEKQVVVKTFLIANDNVAQYGVDSWQ